MIDAVRNKKWFYIRMGKQGNYISVKPSPGFFMEVQFEESGEQVFQRGMCQGVTHGDVDGANFFRDCM